MGKLAQVKMSPIGCSRPRWDDVGQAVGISVNLQGKRTLPACREYRPPSGSVND